MISQLCVIIRYLHEDKDNPNESTNNLKDQPTPTSLLATLWL